MARKVLVLGLVLVLGAGCVGQAPEGAADPQRSAEHASGAPYLVAQGRTVASAPHAAAASSGFQFERVIVDPIEYDWLPEHVVVGDVTGDRLPDVVMSMSAAGSNGRVLIRIYAQQPGGSLAAPIQFKVERAVNWLHSLELADLDANGVQDIALADDTGLTTISRVGGNFVTRWEPSSGRYAALAAIDANGDGHMDLFAVGVEYGSRIFVGDGRGGFSAVQTVETGYGAYALAEATDYTADGRPDLLLTQSFAYYVRIYPFVRGAGLQSEPIVYDARQLQPDISYGATVGDLNRDGRPDLVISDQGLAGTEQPRGVRVLYRGQGNDFTRSVLLSTPGTYTYPSSVAVTDLDGNTYPDIVVMYDSNDAFGYFLQGPTGFAPVVRVQTDDNPWTNNHYGENSFAVADVNSDACPDIVLAEVSSSLRIFYGRNCQVATPATGGPLRPERL